MNKFRKLAMLQRWWAFFLVALLAACSSSPDKPTPTALPPNAALLGVTQAWSGAIGAVNMPLTVPVAGERLAVSGADGTVAVLNGANGRDIGWWHGRYVLLRYDDSNE